MTEEEKQRWRVPVWCPICDWVMKGDNETYFRWGCCKLCFIHFVEDREERWRSGWRPSEADVEAFRRQVGGFPTES